MSYNAEEEEEKKKNEEDLTSIFYRSIDAEIYPQSLINAEETGTNWQQSLSQRFSNIIQTSDPVTYDIPEELLEAFTLKFDMTQDIDIPTETELTLIERIENENIFLREQNNKLTTSIQTQQEDLKNLTNKYNEAVNKSNETLEGLRQDIRSLNDKLDAIQKARTLNFVLPESWFDEDFDEE